MSIVKLTTRQHDRFLSYFNESDDRVVAITRNPNTNTLHVKILAYGILDGKSRVVTEWTTTPLSSRFNNWLSEWGAAAAYAIRR